MIAKPARDSLTEILNDPRETSFDMNETPADRLKRVLDRARLKNPAVAAAAGVQDETVSRWRSGRQAPREAELDAVVALLAERGVTVTKAWLRYGDDQAAGEPAAALTGAPELPDAIEREGLRFEMEVLESGVDRAFRRYVSAALREPTFLAVLGDDEATQLAAFRRRVAQLRSDLRLRLGGPLHVELEAEGPAIPVGGGRTPSRRNA